MASVLDALELPRASIAGNSLGGWMALKFATTYPDRVEKLMLIASGGLADSSSKYLEQAQEAKETGDELQFSEDLAQGAQMPKEILDFLNLILASYDPISVPLPEFSGEMLSRLTMPVLYVAGLEDDMLDTQAGAAAVRAHIPHAEVVLLPDMGHMITTPFVWMLPFLAK